MYEKPTSKILESTNLNWNEIYILPRKVSIDTNLHVFQYTILNSILFLNESLFKFKKVPSPLCSFCKSANETLLHFFCNIAKRLWNELQYFVSLYLYIPEISTECPFRHSAINKSNQLLVFKHYLYMSRKHGAVSFTSLKLYLIKIKAIKQNISPCRKRKNVEENEESLKNSEINR